LNTNVLNAIPNLKNWFSVRRARTAFIAQAVTQRKSKGFFPVSAAFPGAVTAALAQLRLPVALHAVPAVAPAAAINPGINIKYPG